MESRKTKRADVDKLSSVFFQIGLIIVLSVCLMAFEWKTYDKYENFLSGNNVNIFTEEIIEMAKLVEPPPPPRPKTTTILDIKTDDVIIDSDIIIDIEADVLTEIPDYIPLQEIKKETEVPEPDIYVFADVYPEFPGGVQARMEYLSQKIIYPEIARKNNIEGKVFVLFVVEKDGRLTNIKLLHDIGGGCGEEALRVIKSMPAWEPGLQRNQPVRVQMSLPITFQLK